MDDDLAPLIEALAAGVAGDADAAVAAFTDDATLQDVPGGAVFTGPDGLLAFFSAYGGRREQLRVGEVVRDGDRVALEYGVAFRADAAAYGQRGIALLHLRDRRIASWRGVWLEVDEDLSTWGGD